MPPLQNFKKDSGEKATRIVKAIEKVNRQFVTYTRRNLHLTFERKVLTEFVKKSRNLTMV